MFFADDVDNFEYFSLDKGADDILWRLEHEHHWPHELEDKRNYPGLDPDALYYTAYSYQDEDEDWRFFHTAEEARATAGDGVEIETDLWRPDGEIVG